MSALPWIGIFTNISVVKKKTTPYNGLVTILTLYKYT